jgi:hypothetical protein
MRWLSLTLALLACADDPPRGWHVVFDDLEAPVLSAWTSPSGRTFFAGGRADAGLMLSTRDGHSWQRMQLPTVPRLWWVFGFSDDAVWVVGEHGTILFFDGIVWRAVASGTDATLYGVWGTSNDAMWAVGQGGVVLHRDTAWDLEATGIADQGDLYKVWGAGDVVYAIGEHGNILRRDAAGWSRTTSGTTETLRTLAGRDANDVWAVGGTQAAFALHFDGTTWQPAGPTFGAPLVGVTIDGANVLATSATGELFEYGGAWTQIELGLAASLHFVALGGNGRRFAGGGTVDGHGVLVAYGDAAADTISGAPPAPPASTSGGGLPVGAQCASDPNGCQAGYLCYTLQYSPPICSHACATASDCDDLGPHACCALPEGQILTNVCVPSGTTGCP